MAISLVQTQTQTSTSTGATTTKVISTTTTGNTIIVFIVNGTSLANTVTSVGDGTNTYTQVIRDSNTAIASEALIYYATNITGATTPTITVTWSSNGQGNNAMIWVREYSGLATNGLDKSTSAHGFTTALSSGNTATTTQASELLVGLGTTGWQGNTYTLGTNYSNLSVINSGVNFIDGAIEDQIVSATGAYAATFTAGNSTQNTTLIATFKGATASTPAITVSDSSAVTENIGRTLVDNVSVRDSIVVSEGNQPDYNAPGAIYFGQAYPGGYPTDYPIQPLITSFINVSDSTTLSESKTVLIPTLLISTSDSTTVTESIHPEVNSFINKSDSSAVTENVSVQIAVLGPDSVSVSDSSAVSESLKLLVESNVTTSDSSALSESLGRLVTSFITTSDSSAVTESSNVAIASQITTSDSSTVSESLGRMEDADPNISDTIGSSDTPQYYSDLVATRESITVVVSAANTDLNVSVSDSSTVSESLGRLVTSFITTSDATTVSENLALTEVSLVNVSDSTTLSESLQLMAQNFIATSDSTTLSESTTVLVPFYNITVSDSTSITESVTVSEIAQSSYSITTSDSTTLSESLGELVTNFIATSDSSSISESVGRMLESNIATSDSSSLTESLGRLVTSNIAVSDNTTVTEAVAAVRTGTLNLAVSDTTTIGEAIGIKIPATPTYAVTVHLATPAVGVKLSNPKPIIVDKVNLITVTLTTPSLTVNLTQPTIPVVLSKNDIQVRII